MNFLKSMKSSLLAVTFLSLGACSGAHNQTSAVPPVDLDDSCVIAAGGQLSRDLHMEATDGRALPLPDPFHRTVELDAKTAGRKVTYVYECVYGRGAYAGEIHVVPVGHR